MPTDVAKQHWKSLMAMRQQGATDDELEEYLQSIGAERVNTRTGVTGAAENLARGLALGTVQAGTSLAGVGGFLTRPVGGRRIEAWAQEQERKAQRTYDPLGIAGAVGQGVGRFAGEAAQAVAMAGPAAKAVSAIPRAGQVLQAAMRGSRLQQAAATAALSAPVDVIQGLKSEEGLVLPGRAGSVAENVLLSGAVGALTARPRPQRPIDVRRPQEPEPIIVDQRLVPQEPRRPAGGPAPEPEMPVGPTQYAVNTAGPARLTQPARRIGAGGAPAAEVPVTPAAAAVEPEAATQDITRFIAEQEKVLADMKQANTAARRAKQSAPFDQAAIANQIGVISEAKRTGLTTAQQIAQADRASAIKTRVWYDRSSRSWVGQVVDAEGNQIGDAEFAATKKGVEAAVKDRTARETAGLVDEVAQAEQAARAAGADRPSLMDEPLEQMAGRMPKIAPSAARLKKMADDQVAEMWAYYTRLRQRYVEEAGIFAYPDEGEALDYFNLGFTSTRKAGGRMGRRRATQMLGAAEEGRRAAGLSEEQLGWLEERNLSIDDVRKMQEASKRAKSLESTSARLDAEVERRGLDVFGVDDTSFDFGMNANREGFARAQAVGTLGGGVIGATVGAATGETPEERRRRALLGGLAGAGVGLGATSLMTRGAAAAAPRGSTESIRNYNTSIRVGQRPEAQRWLSLSKRLYTHMVSETEPLVQAGREAVGVGGEQAMLEQIAKSQGMGMAAKQYIMDRVDPALKAAVGQWDDVRGLLKARRDLNLREMGGAPKTGFSDGEVRQVVQDAERIPAVRQAADAINGVYRDLLKMKLDAGILTPQEYERILASEDFYDPFVREFSTEQAAKGAGGKRFTVSGKGIGRMDRMETAIADTADPLEVLISSITRTHNAVGRQGVANIFFELADLGELPMVRVVEGDAIPGTQRFRQLRNGVPVTYEVTDPDLYDALAGATQSMASSNPIMQFMRGVKRVKQFGITQNPVFAAVNFVRDLVASGIQRPDAVRAAREMLAGGAVGAVAGGVTAEDENRVRDMLRGAALGIGAGAYARPAAEALRAMSSIVGNDEAYKEFLRRGGSTEGFFVRNPSDARKVLEELQRTGVSMRDIVNVKRWPEVMQTIGSVSELAPRLAAYRQMLEAGASPEAAVLAAHDRTLRFANVGKSTKDVAAVTAFWNAKVQGWDKLARMLKNPRTSAMAMAAITGPTIALWSVNKDNPEYWERPVWERNLFWLVPKADGGFWRIPKPFEIGYIFASAPERFLDYVAQSGIDAPGLGRLTSASPEIAEPQRALTAAAGEMVGSTMGGTLPIPDVLSIPVQLGVNKDIFRGRRIVTSEGVPAEQQVTPESSSLARALAKAGVSPQQTDFVLRSTLGTLGQYGSSAIDAAVRRAGGDAPMPRPRTSGNLPQRFSTKEYSSTELESQARDRLAELEKVHRGLLVEQAGQDPNRIREYVNKNRKNLDAYEDLGELRRDLDRTAAERRQITRNVAIRPERKQQLLDELRTQGDAQARSVLRYRINRAP